jgi:ABC-type uncharacterized transport system substrate-binding protein
MRRRALLLGLGGTVLAAHPAAFARQGTAVRIGFILPTPKSFPGASTLLAQLADHGHVEGQNLTVDYRQVVDDPNLASVAAAVLVEHGVDLIFAAAPSCLEAAINATRTIPIVFVAINFDPVIRGGSRPRAAWAFTPGHFVPEV